MRRTVSLESLQTGSTLTRIELRLGGAHRGGGRLVHESLFMDAAKSRECVFDEGSIANAFQRLQSPHSTVRRPVLHHSGRCPSARSRRYCMELSTAATAFRRLEALEQFYRRFTLARLKFFAGCLDRLCRPLGLLALVLPSILLTPLLGLCLREGGALQGNRCERHLVARLRHELGGLELFE